ncbi:MAG TPA: hypothetical protein VFZ65_17585 [Planctomycetota bacterium]|nr:hypothetical protein [Planctomycetota bacterium]
MLMNLARALAGATLFGLAGLTAQATIETVPPSSTVDLAPGQVVHRIVRVCLPGAIPPVAQADVYLLADTTGSMSSVLNAVKTNAVAVVTALLGSGTDLQIGIGNYKDFPFDPYCFQHQLSPTNNQAAIVAAINTWTAGGGNDTPEGQFFALHQIATDPAIGFRPAAKRIIVWFGDAPAHDPVCAAISGLGFDINEALVTTSLQGAGPGGTTVIAISASSGVPGALNADPGGPGDYFAACGISTGLAGQAMRIAAATGGIDTAIGPPGAIVAAILAAIGTVLNEVDVSLLVSGPMAPFVTNITPPVHANVVIPPDPMAEVCVDFDVEFTGMPCSPTNVFPGSFEALIDGAGSGAILPYSVTQGICGPPVCQIIGAPPMGSVGVPISFMVTGSDGNPAENVTLAAVSMPAGATSLPPLPQIGNPASTTISWTPSNAQLGPNVFSFTVTDAVGQVSNCSVTIDIAECYVLFGFTALNVNLGGPGDDLYVDPIVWYPVTLTSIPDIDIPNDPNLSGLHVFSQVVMFNPTIFPGDPLWLTQGLDATLGAGVPIQFGATNGMQIWSNTETSLGGKIRVRFTLP